MPNEFDSIFVDLTKLEQYCLDPSHPRGRLKARVFEARLGLRREDAAVLQDALVNAAARSDALILSGVDEFGSRFQPRAASHDGVCQVRKRMTETVKLLDVVALIDDRPDLGLRRGLVGTVVEMLDDETFEVEFADDEGRAYALHPLPATQLLTLHYQPQRAA